MKEQSREICIFANMACERYLGRISTLKPLQGLRTNLSGYGSPPVFASTSGRSMPVLTNVFLVQNAEDGLSGASLRYVQVLLIKIEIELKTIDFAGRLKLL